MSIHRIRNSEKPRLVAAGSRVNGQKVVCFDPTYRPFRRDLALDVLLEAVRANARWPRLRGRLMIRDIDRACALSGGGYLQINALAKSIGLGA